MAIALSIQISLQRRNQLKRNKYNREGQKELYTLIAMHHLISFNCHEHTCNLLNICYFFLVNFSFNMTRQIFSLLYVMCQTAFAYVAHVSVTRWKLTLDFKLILASLGGLWSKTAMVCNLATW